MSLSGSRTQTATRSDYVTVAVILLALLVGSAYFWYDVNHQCSSELSGQVYYDDNGKLARYPECD